MSFDPERAAIRFGCGLSPQIAPVPSVGAMLALLQGPDSTAEAYPIPGFDHVRLTLQDIRAERRSARKAKTQADRDEAFQR